MTDIELVIKIDKDIYEARQHWVANPKRMVDEVDIAIANGIPLPKGHGRLIDEGVLKNQFPIWVDNFSSHGVNKTISKTPTVIEADKEEA